jgi:hypothetical protein
MVMCCICFRRFTQDRLNRLPDGALEDVCIHCAAEEAHPTPPEGEPVTTYKISGGGPSTAGCALVLIAGIVGMMTLLLSTALIVR